MKNVDRKINSNLRKLTIKNKKSLTSADGSVKIES
jgi:hypothetical protein